MVDLARAKVDVFVASVPTVSTPESIHWRPDDPGFRIGLRRVGEGLHVAPLADAERPDQLEPIGEPVLMPGRSGVLDDPVEQQHTPGVLDVIGTNGDVGSGGEPHYPALHDRSPLSMRASLWS